MFLNKIKNLNFRSGDNSVYYLLVLFCILLPFQFALNPKAGVDLAIVRVFIPVLFLIWLFTLLKNKASIPKKNTLTFLFAAFLFIATVSLVFSSNLDWSLRKLAFLFSILPIYLIASSVLITPDRRRSIITALISSGAILALLAIFQFTAQFIFGIDAVYGFLANSISPFFLGNSFSKAVLAYPSWLVNANGITYMRAIAIFPDPHMLSYYFGLLIPWSIVLWSDSKKHSHWFFFTTLLLIIGDICTFTRGGYIALITGSLAVLPLVSRATMQKIMLAIITLILFFTIAPHSPVASRFSSSFDVTEGSNIGRLSNWQQAILIIKNHPLGVGIGMYSLAVDPKAAYRQPIYAHNLYLDIAAELGLLAMLILVAILLFTFAYFWSAARTNPFFIAGVSSVTIFAIHSLVETPLYSVHILSLICLIIALSVGIKKYEKK